MLNWLSYYYLYFLDWLNIIFQFQNLQWNSKFLIQVLQNYKNNSIIFNFVLRFDYFDQLTAYTFWPQNLLGNLHFLKIKEPKHKNTLCIQIYEWRCFDLTEDNIVKEKFCMSLENKHTASFLSSQAINWTASTLEHNKTFPHDFNKFCE